MTATALTPDAIHLTEQEEGCVLHAYHDVVGVLTIGFGTTAGAGVVEPIPATCTLAQAEQWLLEYMDRDVVPAALASGFDFNVNQLGAVCDLGYNAGSGVLDAGHSMGNALRAKSIAEIKSAFMDYVFAEGGVMLSDLVHRREADIALFDSPVPHVPSMHYDWFWGPEVKLVEQYDRYRAMQTHRKHPHRAQLAQLRARCHFYAARLWVISHAQRVNGKPSWGEFHRGWRRIELARRASGQQIQPT